MKIIFGLIFGHVMYLHAWDDGLVNHEPSATKVPCRTTHDHVYGGNLTDCSGLNLTIVPLTGLADNITTLLFDKNNLRLLANGTFHVAGLRSLRYLSVQASGLMEIEVDALLGLYHLEVLNLEYNELMLCQSSQRSFPAGMFRHVPNLRELFIAFNIKDHADISTCHTYPDNIDIFSYLPLLTTLSIDTVNKTLYLGPEFFNLTHLTNLTLGCHQVKHIKNSSLYGISQLQVTVLNLLSFPNEALTLATGVFQNIPHVVSLTINGGHFGNQNMLKAIEPLANRKMNVLSFNNTGFLETYSAPTHTLNDGIITVDGAAALRSICVSHFSWTVSFLYAFMPKSVTTGAWPICVRTIDLSNNKLEDVGWKMVLLDAYHLKVLREITLSAFDAPPSSLYPRLVNYSLPDINNMDAGSNGRLWRRRAATSTDAFGYQRNQNTPTFDRDVLSQPDNPNSYNHVTGVNQINDSTRDSQPNDSTTDNHANDSTKDSISNDSVRDSHINDSIRDGHAKDSTRGSQVNNRTRDSHANDSIYSEQQHVHFDTQPSPPNWQALEVTESKFPYNGIITYYSLPSLTKVKIISLTVAPVTLGSWSIVCQGCNNMKELYWINNNLLTAKGSIQGVDSLKVLDLTGSLFDISEHIFDTFHGLEVLVLSNLKPDTFFKQFSISRLLRNLTHLRYLDVSNNKLNSAMFPLSTFTSTQKLTHAIMSQNRFSNIPFNLLTTPELVVLDLSENAILFLTEDEMNALNKHVDRVGKFLLKLQDNGLACVCSRISFLVWAFTSRVTLDQTSPFECLTGEGQRVIVKDISDIPTFSGLCDGSMFLLIALVLASLLVVGFLTAYLLTRFRTSIQAFLIRTLRLKGPDDYGTGVFIGYADGDVEFVRHVLGPYLENILKLTTFIHQRDLMIGLVDEQLYRGVEDSWRILLVLSTSFLKQYDMSDIMMKYASHAVTAANPHRVFVLVEQAEVHSIPDYLDGVLDETRIIVLKNLRQPLTYEQKQSIRQCVRPYS